MKMDDFNEGVDGKLASRMRKVNPEQFLTLVKMHLSFQLDLNTEDNDGVTEKAKLKKWGLLSFSKKPKSTMNLQKGSDGTSLTVQGICRVKQLMEYLTKEQSIVQEGIFRRTGKLTRQQDLKAALYRGAPLELDDGTYSVHDCASVLKTFLAELPEPLLTEFHYPAYCQIAELCSIDTSVTETRLLSSLQLLLLLLPPTNRTLLRHLLSLLNKTAAFESNNKMNCDTLATLFTPHLMCPRKLTPEALHVNSQHLSGLVAFMIKKGLELFEIPSKLATDIRAYWVDQERKLLSPGKNQLNESTSDTTGTAHTVFSFVDHKLTAKANSTQDTQAALAQLYAHIQTMPESAKKRRLVKQFNKENGQGTPRHVKQYRAKSLGDSIKKHIFQKKLLGPKKVVDINIGTNVSRSSSEENILSPSRYRVSVVDKTSVTSKSLFSKSDNELSIAESCENSLETENIVRMKRMSSSTGSLDAVPSLGCSFDAVKPLNLASFVDIAENISERSEISTTNNFDGSTSIGSNIFVGGNNESKGIINRMTDDENVEISVGSDGANTKNDRFSRHNSAPPDVGSSKNPSDDYSGECSNGLPRHNSEPTFLHTSKTSNIQVVYTPKNPEYGENSANNTEMLSPRPKETRFDRKNDKDSAFAANFPSPVVKNKFLNIYAAHTSTPSNLLRRNLANNEYMLTPITSSDKSMSPITQSTTKMSKAMQEAIMTPRSRKPVMMVSGSNLCNLASLDDSSTTGNSFVQNRLSSVDRSKRRNCTSILEERDKPDAEIDETTFQRTTCGTSTTRCNKENVPAPRNLILSLDDDRRTTTIRRSDSASITSTFREYLLSRSVLTASPVDLSFTSRTGDFEQSESDAQIPNDEQLLTDSLLHCLDGNNPGSDTSGIASGSTNSAENSTEIIYNDNNAGTSPRKRGTSLQRHDSKRSIKSTEKIEQIGQKHRLRHKQLSESTLNNVKVKENVQDTSF